jgi:hypothetical protein
MGLIDEKKIAQALEPVLHVVVDRATDKLMRAALAELGPQIQAGVAGALDGLIITVTFARARPLG